MGIRKAPSVPKVASKEAMRFLHLVVVAATCTTGAGGSSHDAIDLFNVGCLRHSDPVDVRVNNVHAKCHSDFDRRQASQSDCTGM